MKEAVIGLIRDVLDKQLVDRDGLPVGRVDGIVLFSGSDNAQPRIGQIESGLTTLARRLSPRAARLLQHVSRRFGFRWRRPVRLPWSTVQSVGRELQLDLCGDNSRLLASERWFRSRIFRRIPGNGIKKTATE